MQRLHPDDLAGYLLNLGGFTHLQLAAIATTDETIALSNDRTYDRRAGELLHPAREPESVLDEARGLMSAAAYAAQYQQDPVPVSGAMLKPEWIMRYRSKPALEGMRITQSWDTANKVAPETDYSVCTTWAERDGNHYLLHVFRKKLGLPELVTAADELYRSFPVDMVLIEEQGSGLGLQAFLRKLHDVPSLGIRAIEHKVTRFANALLYFERRQVAFPEAAPWLADLERELLSFPDSNRHDDQVDSVSQYFTWFRGRGSFSFSFVSDPDPDDSGPYWDPMDFSYHR